MPSTAAAGLIGLGVMGRNLALNIASRGFPLAVYNRTYRRTTQFLERDACDTDIQGAERLEDFVATLERPRRVILMVDAGRPVDAVLEQIIPLLDPDDTIVDGGNSFYPDTERRIDMVEGAHMRYLGTGISGGETGRAIRPVDHARRRRAGV